MTTKIEKQRDYQVLMYGLSEERRICGMDEDTWQRRCQEVLEDCGLAVPANLNVKDRAEKKRR